MAKVTRYESTGWSLEAAVRAAHDQVPNRTDGHLELGMARLVEVKIQRNGFTQAVSFHAVVEEDTISEPWPEPGRGVKTAAAAKFTTLAIGEETPPITTLALGEETPPITTRAIGEEDGGGRDGDLTSALMGEEDAPVTTLPLEEEDSILTTLALGEEDPPLTTRMIGEEDPPLTTKRVGEEDKA